ncbi:hypothetical protein D3C72_1892990 [compost metagenome]
MPSGIWFIWFILPSACSLSAYSFDRIEANGMAMLARNGASLRVRVNLTVRSSTFSTDLMTSGKPMPAAYSHEAPVTYLFQGLSALSWRS